MADRRPHKRPRTAPTQVLALPSSPPPTSPLPPTPKISDPTLAGLLTSSTHPPRSQISLPNLRPQETKSSGSNRRAFRYHAIPSDIPAVLQSPFTSPSKSLSDSNLLTNIPQPFQHYADVESSSGTFTDALTEPPLVEGPSSASEKQPLASEEQPPEEPPDLTANWPFAPSSPRIPSRTRRSTKTPRRAVARSPLFIPSPSASTDAEARQTESLLPRTERIVAVPPLYNDGITSLPPLPSWRGIDDPSNDGSNHPASNSIIPIPRRNPRRLRPNTPTPTANTCRTSRNRDPIKAATNVQSNNTEDKERASLAPAVGQGQVARTQDIAEGEEPVPQPWYVRRRRYMWMLGTLILVLIATAGVLGGIIWRLSRM